MIDTGATMRKIGVVLVVASLAVAGLGHVSAAPVTGPPPASQVVDSGGNLGGMNADIGVWKGSLWTLRANDSTAQTTIPIGEWKANGLVDMNLGPIGVYSTGQTVPVTFDASRAFVSGSSFANESLSVYAVRENDTTGLNVTLDRTNVTDAGQSATELTHIATTTIDGNGTATVQYDADEPGIVRFVAVLTDDPTPTTNLSAVNATVVGMDAIAIQSSSPAVSAPQTVEAGQNVTMAVDTGGTGSAVHAVVLYDESAMANSTVTVQTTGSPVTIEPTIDRLHATVAVRTDNASMTATRRIDMASLFGTVGGPTNTSLYADGSPNETVAIDASVAIALADSNATISVPTESNWSTGSYRYLYLGAANGSTGLETGSVMIEAPSAPPTTTTPTPSTATPTPSTTTPTTTESDDDTGFGGGGFDFDEETTTAGGGAVPDTTTPETTTTTSTVTPTPTTT
ncbi:MAG: hypothetical protein ABEJ86_02160, partial [Halococcoides sp.]